MNIIIAHVYTCIKVTWYMYIHVHVHVQCTVNVCIYMYMYMYNVYTLYIHVHVVSWKRFLVHVHVHHMVNVYNVLQDPDDLRLSLLVMRKTLSVMQVLTLWQCGGSFQCLPRSASHTVTPSHCRADIPSHCRTDILHTAVLTFLHTAVLTSFTLPY